MEASAELFGLSYLYPPSGRWVRDRDPERCHTWGHTHYSGWMLKVLQKGEKIPQTNPNSPQSPLFPRPLNQSSIWLFYCSLLGANLSACVFLKEFASCWAFVLHKCKRQFCPELLPGSSLMCGTAGSNCLQQGGCYRADTPEHCHVFITHFHLRDPAEPISVLKFWNQGKNWATISVALCTTCVEHKPSSVERA